MGNLEGWRAGRRPWGVGDDGRIGNLLKKTQCERGDISKRKRRIYFPGCSEYQLKDHVFHMVQWSNINLFLSDDLSQTASVRSRKSYQVFSLAVLLHAKRIWKGDIVVADIKELEEMDATELHARKDSMQRKCWRPWMVKSVFSPNRRWNGKTNRRRSGPENIHFNPGSPWLRRRTSKNLEGESDGFSSIPLQDSSVER